MKNILVTGGTGYIGSHTVVELINAGYNPIIVDNLSNSKIQVLDRIKTITGVDVKFYKLDCTKYDEFEEVFKNEKIDAVIHFAGLKAVGESCQKPLLYYENNVGSAIVLLNLMKKYDVKNVIFSSSATVYGEPKSVPFYEYFEVNHATNPYGETKIMIERIMQDFTKVNKGFKAILLRYFNPIGAHKSGLIGEEPVGIPNNLMPYITQVAIGKLEYLRVFGNDYDTVDGTGVRDYIHVVDLALGHVASLAKFSDDFSWIAYNLGTGKGTSVLELVNAFEKANNIKIPYKIVERRPGDIAISYANADKAKKDLGWSTKYNIIDCCKDSWNFQNKNPDDIK